MTHDNPVRVQATLRKPTSMGDADVPAARISEAVRRGGVPLTASPAPSSS